MGRKKKPFIDKKHSQTYRLVPRSQQDPLSENVDEAQYVLKALQGGESMQLPSVHEEDRHTEQHKYGIFYNDEYDYLQHLKQPGTAVLEPVGLPSGSLALKEDTAGERPDNKSSLPHDLFGSEVAVEGHLNKIMPVSGPQPNWDPDIVAALEEAEINEGINTGDLDDDFVLQANAGEPGLPVFVSENLSDTRRTVGSPWWKTRVDFKMDGIERSHKTTKSDQSDSDVDSDVVEMGVDDDSMERKSARFTQYSLSSSVVPRSEALTLLDDKFEQFMVAYDDSELGAPDECGVSGESSVGRRCDAGAEGIEGYDQLLLQSAVDDFDKNFKHQLQNMEELEDVKCPSSLPTPSVESSSDLASASPCQTLDITQRHSRLTEDGEEVESDSDDSGDSSEESLVLMKMADKPKEQWDCESILSTYSNIYNHPTKITEARSPRETSKRDQIKLSSKTNLPLGTISGPLPKEKVPKQAPVTRPRSEDKNEKRVRKQAVKEERRQRRADKKETKLAFKSESLRLERQLAGHVHTATVV